jgi:hypothetical protein
MRGRRLVGICLESARILHKNRSTGVRICGKEPSYHEKDLSKISRRRNRWSCRLPKIRRKPRPILSLAEEANLLDAVGPHLR